MSKRKEPLSVLASVLLYVVMPAAVAAAWSMHHKPAPVAPECPSTGVMQLDPTEIRAARLPAIDV